ncbi:MAG: pyridoxamine 5'-phosphate oxidase family protein [Gemmatimonadales bacterium]
MTSKGRQTIKKPVFRELSGVEADEILARNSVGRLARSIGDRIDIELIHYVVLDRCIYGVTSREPVFPTQAHNGRAAFEVDEILDLFEWSSVVVKGTIEIVSAGAEGNTDPILAPGVQRLRALVPVAPVSARPPSVEYYVFRLLVDTMTGRGAGVPKTG